MRMIQSAIIWESSYHYLGWENLSARGWPYANSKSQTKLHSWISAYNVTSFLLNSNNWLTHGCENALSVQLVSFSSGEVWNFHLPMRRAMSMLVRVQWRVWSEGRCSLRLGTQPTALHRCAWSIVMHCHASFALGSPGKTSMPMTFLSSLNHSRNVSGGSWLGEKQWRRKDWE